MWNWKRDLAEAQADSPTATPPQVVVDEKQTDVNGEEEWLFAAFDRIPHERDLWPDRKLGLSDPRVRTWGFQRWISSLLPFTKPALYTQFNDTLRARGAF